MWSVSIKMRLLVSGWMTNFLGVYCRGKATWLKTAPNFSKAKILPDRGGVGGAVKNNFNLTGTAEL